MPTSSGSSFSHLVVSVNSFLRQSLSWALFWYLVHGCNVAFSWKQYSFINSCALWRMCALCGELLYCLQLLILNAYDYCAYYYFYYYGFVNVALTSRPSAHCNIDKLRENFEQTKLSRQALSVFICSFKQSSVEAFRIMNLKMLNHKTYKSLFCVLFAIILYVIYYIIFGPKCFA